MSEPTPSFAAGGVTDHSPRPLTPDVIETVLADFRGWLQEGAASASADGTPASEPPVDLHTLLGQFLALRHEVNLQTKATRAQQEQNAETLRQLGQALEALRQTPKTEDNDEELLRPLLKTLLDVADALTLARREIDRLQVSAAASLEQLRSPDPVKRHLWPRWLGGDAEPPKAPNPAADRVRQLLVSVLTGYAMSLQRVERALQQQGLEPIDAVGEPFDPEYMEVVEAVADSGRPSGEVVAEVRRGFLWNHRVFRYAQVSVAK
jgi:molecular chaperone GrpE